MTTNPMQQIRNYVSEVISEHGEDEWSHGRYLMAMAILAILDNSDWVCVPREPTEAICSAMPSMPALPAVKPWPGITPHQMSNYIRWKAGIEAAAGGKS